MTSPPTIRAKAKCAACGGAVRARDRFCASCGTPIAAAQAAPAPPTVAPPPTATSASLQIPPLGEAALREQRKVVTILFADISGSTPLAEKLDPEDLRRILASYFNQLSRQIRRYEGTIDKYIGDAVMAVFGAPLSHEDDAERAIHAALAMHRSIAKLNDDLEREHGVRLSLRIGINTGEVVAGMLGGGDVQSAYTVVGDAVNTAQRFESIAPLNEVLVSETTRRLALHAFEFETLPPVALKGKAALVPAYRVVRRRDEEIEPDASPLVGRREELAFLRSAVEDALAGRGRVLHIRGEAGVGKSRLVSEFRVALAPNIARIAARCASYETNTPYALIADLVRGAFRIHAVDDEAAAREAIAVGAETFNMPLDETATALLLDVIWFSVSLVIEPEQKRRLLVLLMRSLLQAAGARTSFVVFTEDLHWIDPASGAMLAELVRDMPERPGVFITTARTGWPVPWEAEIVDLPALTEEEARTLIEELFEGGVDDGVARAILERAGGNPFYIEEVARELRRGGSTVPATVQEVIEARLDRLVDQTNRVVRNAAVIGVSFWYRLLERLIPREPLAPHLATLEEEAFIVAKTSVPELTYAFRQPLIREVAYQTQLLAARRATHTAVGQAIEILYGDRLDEFVDLLAYHFQRGEDPAKALHWLVRAGDRARGLYANTEALALFTSALQIARKDDSTFGASAILERIGDVQRLTGQYDAALASYRQAGELPGGSSATDGARIARKSAVAFRAKGDYSAALSALKEARERLGAEDRAEAARIEVQVGEVHFRQGRYDDARGALRAAVDLGERVGADDAVAEGLKLLGNVANNVGDLHEAVELYQRTGAAYERLGDPVGTADVMSNLAMLYRRMDRFEESLDAYLSSLALREKVGHVWGVATTHNNLGELSRTRGEPRAAIPSYEWAMGIFERIGARVEATVVLMNLGAARVEAGDVEPGRETLHEAERRFVELGGTKFLPSVHRDLAFGALKAGEIDEAERHAERALELARDAKAKQTEAVVQRIIAEIALARGEREKARIMLLSAIEALRALDESAERRKAEAVLARV